MSDWHGVERVYDDGTRRAGSLRAFWPRRLDRAGVRAAWGELDDPAATVLAGVTRVRGEDRRGASTGGVVLSAAGTSVVAPDEDPRVVGVDRDARGARGSVVPRGTSVARGGSSTERDGGAWAAAFDAAVAAIVERARVPVVALGGGLDGAAVLAAWRASGAAMPAVVTIATGLADYDEVDDAIAIARGFGARCEALAVTPAQVVDAVPEAVPVGEAPLYNLHPVVRHVLACELARRGHDVLVTGDGGDAVFAGRPDHDYVPIVAAYTTASLRLASPYFAPAVIAATRPDPERHALRDYVVASGVVDRPKRRRMMPELDVGRLVDRTRIEALAMQLDLAPAEDVRWVTLDYLVRSFR